MTAGFQTVRLNPRTGTQGYILDNLDAERKRNAIREALSGNNGLSVLNCTHSA